MKKIIILFSVFILSACCSTQKYKELLDSRMGISESELIERAGNPSSVYNVDNKKYLEYSVESTNCNQYGCNKYWCKTQYTIVDGIVSYWTAKGNSCCM